MGNYLGKSRVNVFLSKKCRDMILKLTEEYGISSTAVIELAVRKWYREEFAKEIAEKDAADRKPRRGGLSGIQIRDESDEER